MAMSWTSLFYLLVMYWPYLLGAGLIGIVVGWRSFAPPKS
jgi:hypothetical protein